MTATATAEHPNVATLRRIVAAFNAADTDTLETLVSPELDYLMEGRSPVAGRYRGHEGMRTFTAALHGRSDGGVRVEPITMATDDAWLIMLARVQASRSGRQLDGVNVYIYHFDDGQLAAARNVPCDQYTWDAFWTD